MVSFSTLEMKIAIHRTKPDEKHVPLSEASVEKLRKGLLYCVDRDINQELFVVCPGKFVASEDFVAIKAALSLVGATMISFSNHLYIITTLEQSVILVHMCGGNQVASTKEEADKTTPKMKGGQNRKRPRKSLPPTSDKDSYVGGGHVAHSDDEDSDSAGALTQECAGL